MVVWMDGSDDWDGWMSWMNMDGTVGTKWMDDWIRIGSLEYGMNEWIGTDGMNGFGRCVIIGMDGFGMGAIIWNNHTDEHERYGFDIR